MLPVRRALRDLRHADPALALVSVSWLLVNLAEWAYITALAVHEYRLHGALAVGLIGARFVPGAVLGLLVLGALTRYKPAPTLRLLAVGRTVAVAAVAGALAAHAPFAIVVVLVWIDAVVAAPYRPMQSSILPALAGSPRELSAVAGFVPTMKAFAQAAGALIGSVMLAITGIATIVGAAAAVFLLAAGLVVPAGTETTVPLLDGDKRTRGAIRAGFKLIARRARPLLFLGGARSLTRGLWTSLAVVVSIEFLHLGSAGVGYLMAAAGLGAAIAIPLSLQFAGRDHLARPGLVAFALSGFPIFLVGVIATPVPAIILIALWGIAFALADSISNSLIHRVVEARLLAPSIAAIEASKLLLEGIGALLAPALLAIVGIRDALLIVGAPLPVMVALSRAGLLSVDRRARHRTRPIAALRDTPSFRGLTMLSLENIASRLQPSKASEGDEIVRQGEVGDRFYLIDSGRVEVKIDGFRVGVLGAGGSFGERALLRASPRSATVTALAPTTLWQLDGRDFIAAATGEEGPVARRTLRSRVTSTSEALAAVPLLRSIDPNRLAALGSELRVSKGGVIVREGDQGDAFYMLIDGAAEVTIGGRLIRRLEPGDSFGEIALLYAVPRTATVTAAEDIRVWRLGREQFLATVSEGEALGGVGGDAAATSLPARKAGLVV
jgi:CRP-like cAMP-binding protein